MEVLLLNNDLRRLLVHCQLAFARLYQPSVCLGIQNGYLTLTISNYDAKMQFRCRITQQWGVDYEEMQINAKSIDQKNVLMELNIPDGRYSTFLFYKLGTDMYDFEIRQSGQQIYKQRHGSVYDCTIDQFVETHCYAFVFNLYELKEYTKGQLCQHITLRLTGSDQDSYYKFKAKMDNSDDETSFNIDCRIKQLASIDDTIEYCPLIKISKLQLINLCDHMGNLHVAVHIFPNYSVWVNNECTFVLFA